MGSIGFRSRYGYSSSDYDSRFSDGYGRGYRRSYSRSCSLPRKSGWEKGKKNSNAWVRIIEVDGGGKAAIGGAWFYDFYRKQLFTLNITPKYSAKSGDSYESVNPWYTTNDGRTRYKVKCVMTNKNTLEKFYSTGFYNPDTGKVYFENIDVMVNFNKRTACMNPFKGNYKPQRKFSKR